MLHFKNQYFTEVDHFKFVSFKDKKFPLSSEFLQKNPQ
jgi:hypothetical protein